MESEYRFARSSEEKRVAAELHNLHSTAGVLVVDAQGHGIISAKIASTVHDIFHALMLTELDRYGRTTPLLFDNINLRLAQSVTARNALAITEKEEAREIATMLYGEIRPGGHFRFVNFGHPPPMVYSAEYRKFLKVDPSRMVQFLPLGLQVPADHPDRRRYYSIDLRKSGLDSSDVAEITLVNPGDVLVLYTDGVYDGSDEQSREMLESVMHELCRKPAKDMCNALLELAVKQDDQLRLNGDEALIDDKTVVIIKRI
jgi:serine phosphatase RsbU (regulator of sigma subunit)